MNTSFVSLNSITASSTIGKCRNPTPWRPALNFVTRTPDLDQQEMALWIGTVGVGAMEAVEHLGGGILKGIASKVLGKVVRRGLPVLEVVGSSATHVVATYMLARKVNVYCGEIEATVEDLDPRRLRNWTMLSLGTVVDQDEPKTVKDAFRE